MTEIIEESNVPTIVEPAEATSTASQKANDDLILEVVSNFLFCRSLTAKDTPHEYDLNLWRDLPKEDRDAWRADAKVVIDALNSAGLKVTTTKASLLKSTVTQFLTIPAKQAFVVGE